MLRYDSVEREREMHNISLTQPLNRLTIGSQITPSAPDLHVCFETHGIVMVSVADTVKYNSTLTAAYASS